MSPHFLKRLNDLINKRASDKIEVGRYPTITVNRYILLNYGIKSNKITFAEVLSKKKKKLQATVFSDFR